MSLIDDIKKHEGFSPVVYQCTAGYDTIGYGQRIKYLRVTKEQAEEWLEEELANLKYIKVKDYKSASTEMLDSKWARDDTPRRAKELSDRMKHIG